MLIVDLHECEEFSGGDRTVLRELLHPGRQSVAVSYSLAHAVLRPGCVSVPHRLTGSEVYYILRGSGRMHIDGEQSPVGPGQAVYIPPGATQHIENTGDDDLLFLCIVDPAWHPEQEEVLDQ